MQTEHETIKVLEVKEMTDICGAIRTRKGKVYVAPHLVFHGDLRSLTQGGSAGVIKTKSANTGGAQCGGNMTKRC